MPDIFLGEFDTDFLPPVIVNQSPADLATSVPETTNIDFDVLDDSGVDTSTITITINAVPIVLLGVIQPGYVVTYSPIVGGSHVSVNPATNLAALTSFLVSVTVRDLAPIYNELTDTWTFTTTGDTTLPVITNRLPAPAATGVLVTSAVSFDLLDVGGSGINLSTLNVSLSDETSTSQVIVSGVTQPGYSVSITPIVGGYHVSADIIGNLLIYETYDVDVDVEDIAGNQATSTWSWSTEEGVSETPILNASGLDAAVYAGWYVNPAMRVTYFQLRRSLSSYPTTVNEGSLVYQGTAQSFHDQAVVNGTVYFYTVFVVRKVILGVPLYVAYDARASDDALPRHVTLVDGLEAEYVPTPGELGSVVAIPWPHGRLTGSWGEPIGGGLRADHDVWLLARGREIVAPVAGTVSELGSRTLSIDTDTGIRVRLYGQVSPTRGVGERVETGELVGSALGGEAMLQLHKLPSGGYGRRSIRPSYLYLRAERRL